MSYVTKAVANIMRSQILKTTLKRERKLRAETGGERSMGRLVDDMAIFEQTNTLQVWRGNPGECRGQSVATCSGAAQRT